jgi:hypothetical protein
MRMRNGLLDVRGSESHGLVGTLLGDFVVNVRSMEGWEEKGVSDGMRVWMRMRW